MVVAPGVVSPRVVGLGVVVPGVVVLETDILRHKLDILTYPQLQKIKDSDSFKLSATTDMKMSNLPSSKKFIGIWRDDRS